MPPTAVPLAAIALISASALAYEILLTRIFAIVHWHHLVAIAISLALLGYGASGSVLAVAGARLRVHFAAAFVGNALLFAVSTLACVTIAQQLPFDPQALAWDYRQIFYLAALFAVLALPLFAAANCIGLALWRFPERIPQLYAYDLIGAGAGAVVLLVILAMLQPATALFVTCVGGLLTAVGAAIRLRWYPGPVTLVATAIAGGVLLNGLPDVQPAPYKDLARSLDAYGAELDSTSAGVAGVVQVVRNEQVPLRHAPGMSLQAVQLPPPQQAVFVDGDAAGVLGDYRDEFGTQAYFRQLAAALPFTLREGPITAVFNAGVGEGVARALALGASKVTAVEPNPQLPTLACGTYRLDSAAVCGDRLVDWQTQSPRAYLAGEAGTFDLIVQSVDADASGVAAFKVDFDLTTEAFVTYLRHLTPRGVLSIDGPTRVPPRLSLRLLSTARDALLASGVRQPARHLAMIRAWQRFVLLVSQAPLSAADQQGIRHFAATRGFDLVWLPDMHAAEANRFQVLNEPQFFNGAAAILDPARATKALPDRFRIEPATDNRPYPLRFTRWSEALVAIRDGGGEQLASVDTALLIGMVTLLLAAVASSLLILLPLSLLPRPASGRATTWLRVRTVLYFGVLGFAFLFLELAWIERLQLFLGHPVYATTAVLAALLVFAGLGSRWSQRRRDADHGRTLHIAVFAILAINIAFLGWLPTVLEQFAGASIAARIAIVLVMLAPIAFAMGIPFPIGLRHLAGTADALVPWAWGINGCASVISAAAAPLLAQEIGFTGLSIVATAGYLSLPLLRGRDRED